MLNLPCTSENYPLLTRSNGKIPITQEKFPPDKYTNFTWSTTSHLSNADRQRTVHNVT